MNQLRTIVQADPWRKTRFHDMRGNFISPRSVADLPRVTVESAMRKFFGHRPVLPWISYDAVRYLQSRIRNDWRVLEFGAGMSTIWWAQHCQHVHSIELNAVWYGKVMTMLSEYRLTNVRLELRREDNYTDLSEYEMPSFDFVMIDAAFRDECVDATLRLIKRGGCMYLDNTDFGAQWDMYAKAERILLEAAARDNAKVTHFTGMAPGSFVAGQGVLVEWDS